MTAAPLFAHFGSTPRNLLISTAVALSQQDADHGLFILDQPENILGNFASLVQRLGHPFSSIHVLRKGVKGAKHRTRRESFEYLSRVAASKNWGRVYTGNDRRVEYQYFVHCLDRAGIQPEVFFLDEGIGSYVNGLLRKPLRRIENCYVHPWLKKIVYGRWFQTSREIGATSRIDKRFLFYPGFFSETDSRIEQLSASLLTSSLLVQYCRSILQLRGIQLPDMRPELSLGIVALPFSRGLGSDSVNQLRRGLDKVADQGGQVFAKYHPAEANEYLDGCQVQMLDKSLPLELYMTLLDFDWVVGGLSSALLSAASMRPNACVLCVDPALANESSPYATLYESANVKLIDGFNSALLLVEGKVGR